MKFLKCFMLLCLLMLPLNTNAITIAVIDSGVNGGHPLLKGHVLPGINFTNNSADVSDTVGHGTAVAGIIAQTCYGLDYKILPLKVYNGDLDYEAYLKALQYASLHADIVNISLDYEEPEWDSKSIIESAKGTIFVAPSGNQGDGRLRYPFAYENVFGVASLNEFGQHSAFSNFNEFVDASVIGENLLSADLAGGYKHFSGTSFATAKASGIIAVAKTILKQFMFVR